MRKERKEFGRREKAEERKKRIDIFGEGRGRWREEFCCLPMHPVVYFTKLASNTSSQQKKSSDLFPTNVNQVPAVYQEVFKILTTLKVTMIIVILPTKQLRLGVTK